jgi:MoaA/NifB/PqqE/SkfB family radical SAM enzyme
MLFTGMPAGRIRSRGVLAAEVIRKAAVSILARQRLSDAARSALAEAIFLEIANRTFGPTSMIRQEHGFFPHIFMPDYRGPAFDEAIRRIVLPGRGPNILYFSLTGVCPCHCEYCFAGAGGSATDLLDDGPVLDVARKVAELRVPLVNISGGEPLTRYSRLLQTVRLLNEGSEVRMFTTGFGLTEARLAELREAGLKGVFVSLDTDVASVFDAARGKEGAFEAAVSALKMCSDAGMLTFVNCVVDRTRFARREDIVSFLRFIESIDPRIVVNCLPQLATGRGTEADSFRAPEECDGLAELIVETAQELGRPVTMLFGTVDKFIGCPGAGGKLMNIDIAGNVTVCISKAGLGNLLEEPFEVIHDRFVDICRELRVGFFCCEVGERGDGELLDLQASRAAVHEFYGHTERASWQRVTDRVGWLFDRLLPSAV